ncbi:hypothetical protein C1W90_11195 [Burkholderia pseudomallei]|nr:hypothetical protein EGY14_08525 [Burkholderia pseudomallei]MBM5595388.1 hypothetical protein [Burkholderia pseudomallei]MBM5626385.1 hypothetical protein [Burkholderia pseudomallei]MBM5664312.1 hypothetical protein [Burkholderia pseudomallei]MPT73612.1 hypothetical protein [Burkholderia pseudomallei]
MRRRGDEKSNERRIVSWRARSSRSDSCGDLSRCERAPDGRAAPDASARLGDAGAGGSRAKPGRRASVPAPNAAGARRPRRASCRCRDARRPPTRRLPARARRARARAMSASRGRADRRAARERRMRYLTQSG